MNFSEDAGWVVLEHQYGWPWQSAATNCGHVSSLAADRQGAGCTSARLRPVCWANTASILAVVQCTEISRRQFWIHRGDRRLGASLEHSLRLNVCLLSPVTCWCVPANSAKQAICYCCLIICIQFPFLDGGSWWHSWLRHCATAGKPLVRFPMVSLELFIDIIHPAALCPWGRLSL